MSTGSLALRLYGAEELLVRSDRFRQKVGAPDVLTAKSKVYVSELLDVLEMVANGTLAVLRPCAIIGALRHSYTQIGQGSQIDLGANGGVWVIFTDNAECPDDHKQSCLNFIDWTSDVMDEVAALVGRDIGNDTPSGAPAEFTLWPFKAMEMMFEPIRPDFADRQAGDDFWLVGYSLTDSIGGGGG